MFYFANKELARAHFHQVYFTFSSGSYEDQKYWKLISLRLGRTSG